MDAETPKPTKLWQWLILYPAILTSLGGAIPTVWQAYKSWRLDVSYSQVAQAEAQQALWEKNLDCLAAKPVYSVEVSDTVQVGVTLCPSGDALLRYQIAEDITYTWVHYPRKGEGGRRKAASAGTFPFPLPPSAFILQPFPPSAGAAEPPTPLTKSGIVFGAARCSTLKGGLAIRIYTTDGSACSLEHVLLATGVVLSRVRVPCTTSCKEL